MFDSCLEYSQVVNFHILTFFISPGLFSGPKVDVCYLDTFLSAPTSCRI
jgi:hypothetical protein